MPIWHNRCFWKGGYGFAEGQRNHSMAPAARTLFEMLTEALLKR